MKSCRNIWISCAILMNVNVECLGRGTRMTYWTRVSFSLPFLRHSVKKNRSGSQTLSPSLWNHAIRWQCGKIRSKSTNTLANGIAKTISHLLLPEQLSHKSNAINFQLLANIRVSFESSIQLQSRLYASFRCFAHTSSFSSTFVGIHLPVFPYLTGTSHRFYL